MTHRSKIAVVTLALSMFVTAAGFSSARGANDLDAGNSAVPTSSAPRGFSATFDRLQLQSYQSLAREMATRYQFPQGSSVSLPGNKSVWTSPLSWMEQKVTSDDGQANDLFGFRVLISGDTAFISAPAPIYRPGSLYVFKKIGATWTQTQKLVATPDVTPPPNWSDFFGWSLACSGNTLIVGAPFTFGAQGPIGAAFLFTESNGVWTQTDQLTASDAAAATYFGQAVGLVDSTAVIGSYNRNGGQGAAYVFTNSAGAWSESQLIVASDGVPGDGHQFGEALAFNGSGIVIGAPGPDFTSNGVYPQGAAYVFGNLGGSWTESQKLTAADGTEGDQFGFAIGLITNRALIGAPAANIGATAHQGAAYIFERSGGILTQTQKLTASDGAAYDQFGQSVALQRHIALIGEWSHDDDFNHTPPPPKQGMSYLFHRTTGPWRQTWQLSASDGEPGDSFGWDVDLDHGAILIGAQGSVDGNIFQGAAYFYDRSDN